MNIVGISGSATGGSSTDLLIEAVLEGASDPSDGSSKPARASHIKTRLYRLNERQILPCQACGSSPEPDYCFFHDGMDELFKVMEKSEGIILGSPVYFDSVSAQTKLFIDRTNCLRPADFSDRTAQKFKAPRFKGKKGGIILVAGDYGKFEGAMRVAKAFFIWAGIDIVFELNYQSKSLEVGEVKGDHLMIGEARRCGRQLLDAIGKG
jgi:multimeric flavodoxin WrbA